jgi:hypothetical protein
MSEDQDISDNKDNEYVKIDLLIPLSPPSSEQRLEKRGYDLHRSWTRPEVVAHPTAAWTRAVLRRLGTSFPEYQLSTLQHGPVPAFDLTATLMMLIASQPNTVIQVAGRRVWMEPGDAIILRLDRIQTVSASHYLFILLY